MVYDGRAGPILASNTHGATWMPRTKTDQKILNLAKGGLVTVAQASAFLKISRSKIYQMIGAGELESVTIGSCRRVPLFALENLVARNLEQSTAVA
jgi:excisionase family DNA binding protein